MHNDDAKVSRKAFKVTDAFSVAFWDSCSDSFNAVCYTILLTLKRCQLNSFLTNLLLCAFVVLS